MPKSRKVCIVVASRANYGRIKSVIQAVADHPQLTLQLVVGASALIPRFGKVIDVIAKDGFKVDSVVHYVVEGEVLETQAKTTGLGILELSSVFQQLKPDFVITVADRFETMATAIAASYAHIPLVHVQGGEVSGNIDDRVRHSVSKLSDLHFPCTAQSRERLLKMGESPDVVFNFGCPAIDVALSSDLTINNEIMKAYSGVGDGLDWAKPYVLLVQHPVTTSFGQGLKQINESLKALLNFPQLQKVVLWPNSDAGSDDVSKGMRVFRERKMAQGQKFQFFRNFSPEDYVKVLANAKCCIGNSSSFIREGAALGVPAVLVGDRQLNREHGQNVAFSTYDASEITKAIECQLSHGRYPHEPIFGSGTAGVQIADCLASIEIPKIKQIQY